jgi:hypothetical protein
MGDSYSKSTTGRKDTLAGRRINGHLISRKVQPTRHREIYGMPSKNLLMMPARLALALQADGWILRSDIIWHKEAVMPESVKDRPSKSHEYVFLLAKSGRYFYDIEAIKEPLADRTLAGKQFVNPTQGRNRRTVWTVNPEPFADAHFATFPPALISPMIEAGCPRDVCCMCGYPHLRITEKQFISQADVSPTRAVYRGKMADENHWNGFPRGINQVITIGFGPSCECGAGVTRGIVLDPFMGSGTTALVARRLGRDYVGCDLNLEYCEMARKRIDEEDPGKPLAVSAGKEQLSLFADQVV